VSDQRAPNPYSRPARRQSSVEAPTPAPDTKRAPVAAEARAKLDRVAQQRREAVRRRRQRDKTGEVFLPGKPAEDWKAIRLLRAWGMKSLSDDADRPEIIEAWDRYFDIQFGPE